MAERRTDQGRQSLGWIALGVGVFILAYLSEIVVSPPGGAALVWPSNAVLLAVALRVSPRRLWAVLGVGLAAMLLAAPASHADFRLTALCGLANMVEIGFATVMLRRLWGGSPDLSPFRNTMSFALVAAVAPVLSGLTATLLLFGLNGKDSTAFLGSWWVSDMLGLLIVTPAAIAIGRTGAVGVGGRRPRWIVPVAMLGVLAAVAGHIVLPAPTASILGLAVLVLVGAELGGGATTIAVLVVSLTAIARVALTDKFANLETEQVWLAAQALLVMSVSSLFAQHRQLRAELLQRLRLSERERLAISDSERLGRLAGAVAAIGYWRTDFRTDETVWSEEMLRILGLEPDGRPDPLSVWTVISTIVVEEDRPRMAQISETMRQDGQAWDQPVTIRRASDGATRRLALRGEPERDAAGEIVAVLCVGRDITEENQAREALAKGEALYRLVTEHSKDPVLHLTLDGVIRFASAAVRQYGYKPSDLVGRSAAEMVHPDDLPELGAFLAQLPGRKSLEGITFQGEFRIQRADGKYVWVEGNPSLMFDAAGEVDGYVNCLRDIAQRKVAEGALSESERRYRTIAERVTDIISITDADGRFSYLSPAIKAATGYSPEELVGDVWARHVHPEDLETAEAAYLAVARGEQGAVIRYRILRKTGGWVWLEARPVALRAPDGRFESFLDVIRDAGLQVELEAELRAAKEAAERAAVAKAEFLANMSHEIRTPLTAVLGFAQVLGERTDLSDESRVDLGRIDHAGRTLMAIVNDILDLSKLEAGQISLKPEPTEMRDLMTSLVDMLAPQAQAKGLGLALTVGDALPEAVSMDADRIRQVVVNLVGNAIKFTDAGQVDVEVDYAPDRQILTVRVRDSGPGLDDEQRALLFQRFSQVETSVARKHGGTGLGLAICRGLIEAMGGVIDVDSRPGDGACFHFAVPAAPCEAARPAEARVPLEGGARILVTDDNASNRDLAARLFAILGFEVDLAAGGAQSVAACRATAYDLILMDIRMPVVDGPAAARTIREVCPLNRTTPILAFTADVDAGLIERFPDLFTGVIRKPIEMSQMSEAVAQALAMRSPAAA